MITGRLQEKSNHWYCILNLHHLDGTRQQKWVSTGLKVRGNKRAAEEILFNLRKEYTTLCDIERASEGVSFADYMQAWLHDQKGRVAKSTYCSYSDVVNKHILPYFEAHPVALTHIKADDIEEYYADLSARGLSPNTILHHHANIHKALRMAQKRGMISMNPAALVDRPQKKKFIPEPYSREETKTLLQCIKDDPIYVPVSLAVFYGLRRSEVTGLRWRDINFDKGTITIKHSLQVRASSGKPTRIAQNSLKRNASFRTLPLIPEMAELLAQYKNQNTMKGGGDDDYIFHMVNGDIIKPTYLSARFSKAIKKNGLRHIRFHDLRHGCASMLISERVPLIEVQQWLGHSNISTTADMYAHLDYSMKERSATVLHKQLYL